MNRAYRILPVYTGDVSGVCSALYELGGMVVIHDPSGCNSTYNTHDETRWYEEDSLIFISGLTERDAILGNDDKFIRDITVAAREFAPRFIALCGSPIPYLSGTDLAAISRLVERDTGVPCFYVPTNGMHDYTYGAGKALEALAERFPEPRRKRPGTVNILGLTPLDYGVHASGARMQALVEEAGFSVVSCWAMGSSLDTLLDAGEAEVNLVVSSLGFPAAECLRRRFGTPYVAGSPIGPFKSALFHAVRRAAETGECRLPCKTERPSVSDGANTVIGDAVIMGSLAAAIRMRTGKTMRLICPLETGHELLNGGDRVAEGEEDLEAFLQESHFVIADPFYREVLPAAASLSPLPHQAFSGRNGWKTARDLLALEPEMLL